MMTPFLVWVMRKEETAVCLRKIRNPDLSGFGIFLRLPVFTLSFLFKRVDCYYQILILKKQQSCETCPPSGGYL
jgi:hypothetical protein